MLTSISLSICSYYMCSRCYYDVLCVYFSTISSKTHIYTHNMISNIQPIACHTVSPEIMPGPMVQDRLKASSALSFFPINFSPSTRLVSIKELKNIVDLGTIWGFQTPTSLLQSKTICSYSWPSYRFL